MLKQSKNTMQAVAEEFIEKYAKEHTVGWRNAERAYQHYVVPHLGKRPIDKISRSDIHKLLDGIVADGKVGTAREVKRHLCTLFN